MKNKKLFLFPVFVALSSIIYSCNNDDIMEPISETNGNISALSASRTASLANYFGNNIDLNNLANYSNQNVPLYVLKNNTPLLNPVTNAGATLGRVLFYDKNLSVNNQVSCASCHKQELAFGDNAIASQGANGTTGRHSMRLVNAAYSSESRFFWDERASSLEIQSTMPIKDHKEMGFSGENSTNTFNALIVKLQGLPYYNELFTKAYGNTEITENKIQKALAQFVRSITSFDAKYDLGRSQVLSDLQNFPNFTAEENLGKKLFMEVPIPNPLTGNRMAGGVGCATCHLAPEFGITPISSNNGIISKIGSNDIDITVTKSPSLRDLVNNSGNPNGPMMHSAVIANLEQMIDHYNTIPKDPRNTNLDLRLAVGNTLNITPAEKRALIAFMKTLTGKNIYTDKKWSNPFIN